VNSTYVHGELSTSLHKDYISIKIAIINPNQRHQHKEYIYPSNLIIGNYYDLSLDAIGTKVPLGKFILNQINTIELYNDLISIEYTFLPLDLPS
ncbi:MAG TPA: hypothetical protein PJ990_09440, partial [Saprospiraceae bacterium]|nr:hypothetical protein [Saprospiraceae bacterium]